MPHFIQRETQAQRGSEGREGSWFDPSARPWGWLPLGPPVRAVLAVPPEVSLGEKGEASGSRLHRCESRPPPGRTWSAGAKLWFYSSRTGPGFSPARSALRLGRGCVQGLETSEDLIGRDRPARSRPGRRRRGLELRHLQWPERPAAGPPVPWASGVGHQVVSMSFQLQHSGAGALATATAAPHQARGRWPESGGVAGSKAMGHRPKTQQTQTHTYSHTGTHMYTQAHPSRGQEAQSTDNSGCSHHLGT